MDIESCYAKECHHTITIARISWFELKLIAWPKMPLILLQNLLILLLSTSETFLIGWRWINAMTGQTKFIFLWFVTLKHSNLINQVAQNQNYDNSRRFSCVTHRVYGETSKSLFLSLIKIIINVVSRTINDKKWKR